MPLSATVTFISPISDIPGDETPLPEIDPAWFPAIWIATEVEFNITFAYSQDEIVFPILSCQLSSITPTIEGITTYAIGADTIKVKGTPINIFKDEIFRFVFKDKTEKNLSPTNTEDWLAIVGWGPPSSNMQSVNWQFSAVYSDPIAPGIPAGSATFNSSQYIAWDYVPSLNYFTTLVSKGKV